MRMPWPKRRGAKGGSGIGGPAKRRWRCRLGFRIAYFLYRRFGIVRPLADRLADRVEHLLIMRFVIERLVGFNDQQIARCSAPGSPASPREIIDQRRDAIAGALDALRRQYPDYVAELEARFLRQSTLRQEMTRYQSLLRGRADPA